MRNRIITILPIIFGALIVAWFLFMPKKTPTKSDDAGAPIETAEPFPEPPPPMPMPTPDPTPVAVTASPTISASAVAIATDAAADAAELYPEPLPELDAFFKIPPNWSRMTAEEKRDYQGGLFETLARKEAALERELAAADLARDKAKADQKRVTLDHLRSRRIEIVAGVRARQDAEP